ncbi:MAG TPA: pyridoxal-phosphate dependent enzyme [Steroidobacteraceae bacterium]|nr:pyridoxal-phosphate dependent enzyme [Steroidobacteraceae bacterium]
MISLSDVEAAAARIHGHVRRTPVLRVGAARLDEALVGWSLPQELYLKLELLQVTGSFKPRGAFNRALLEPREALRGLVTSSGGNHGIAMAHVGRELGVPVAVPLFATVSPEKVARMRALGAEAEIVGPTFQVSNARAREIAGERNYLYIHPFAEGPGIAGAGTIGLEILQDVPEVDVVVIAVGGGGLLGGVSLAIKERRPQVRILGVEPTGADALTRSLEAGQLVTLDRINTKAATLAPPASEQINLELARRYVDEMVHVTDEEMQQTAQWLWQQFAIPTELAGAASTAALLTGRARVKPGSRVVSIVCGAGAAGWTA